MQSEAELVLNLFLKFGIFEARCSYKVVLIKKSVYHAGRKLNYGYFFRVDREDDEKNELPFVVE